MLKSQEILNSIRQMQDEVKNLQKEGKTDDALAKLNEIENKKKEYDVQKAVEDMEKQDFEDKAADKKKKEELVNGLSKEKIDFINAVRTNQFSNNFSTGSQGAIIPTAIAKDIIEQVKERFNIMASSTKFNQKGTISFPVYGTDAENTGIAAAYTEDFTELAATSGKFTSVDLKEHLIGALTIIGKSLIANTDIAVYQFIVGKIADAIVDFLQSEMTKGNSTKIKGYETTSNTVKMEEVELTVDDLINMQMAIKTPFQGKATWRMNSKHLNKIRKFTDANGQYVLNPDLRTGFGMVLLGKPVEINEEAESICYGDFSGYYTNVVEQMEVQVLTEKYATQHCVGVCAYVEVDGKPVDTQKYVKLVEA